MISLKTLADVKIITGPSAITRYNNLKSITISGKASNGHSSGEAIAAIEEIAQKNLPKNFKYEWTGAALQEKSAASQKVIIFSLALLFSYLFLVALYESWLMPVVVLISIIVGLFGAYFAMFKFGVMNNLYAQIGIVVLIALASKNAILIVELAMEKSKEGKSAFVAAVEASGERFRAIMMTSFAFILGVFPLVNADGAGAETQRSVSTAVFGGMLSSSLIGIYFIPGLYILFQNIADYLNKNVRNEDRNT
jgi:multidrug efflux pump subunit AcrB